jgi:ABC-type multidrug transport system ATPase subunit
MKRRLSVGISILGSPRIVFLDEPSTGLDPASRYTLWSVILECRKRCSMILTTHSMEEADALCSRLAIFKRGRLRAIGYSADLKARFGQGTPSSLLTSPHLPSPKHTHTLSLLLV